MPADYDGEMRRRGARSLHRRAQATMEFALVAPLFLLVLFASIDASVWAVQSTAIVAATEQAARVAASASLTASTSTTPDSNAVFQRISPQLRNVMFGTTLAPWCDGAGRCPGSGGAFPYDACPTSPTDQRFGSRANTLVVCVQTLPSRYTGDSHIVEIHVLGYVRSLVPPSLGLGWKAGQIPVNVVAATHVLTFAE